MSEPPPPPMISPVVLKPPPPSAEKATATTTNRSSSDIVMAREYKRGNWTLHETLTLITAKKLHHDRRRRATPTAALRWKWVEDYCWDHGCLRSQSQCNDKWDNLLRDYKKLHHYQQQQQQQQQEAHSSLSYWEMERQQRKERDLPSNLPLQVYQALNEAQLTFRNKDNNAPTTTTTTTTPPTTTTNMNKTHCRSQVMPTTGTAAEEAAPPPPTTAPPPPAQPTEFSVESSDSSETNGAETKRRKVRGLESRIVRSAGVMARAMLAREEKRERRHRDLMDLEERRLRIEEARAEFNRRGRSGLVSAVNNLSNALQAIASDRRNNAT
ncbi:hypothetical protein Syun_022454 [Stephania yunnanensis]|uniref:Myb-like domain-containing protein n=1 Tax=Stephania yunnanensis TaxID=152371 RepID=A0AAP0FD01_9MAGN